MRKPVVSSKWGPMCPALPPHRNGREGPGLPPARGQPRGECEQRDCPVAEDRIVLLQECGIRSGTFPAEVDCQHNMRVLYVTIER